jgi:hypothetical protein
MALIAEIKKELRVVELARKGHENEAQKLRQKENRLRALAAEFGGVAPAPKPGVKRPMSEETKEKIRQAMKRRFAKN